MPLVGFSAPHIRRMAVVLPAPSGPTSPTISPARTCRLSPSSARKVPKVLTRPSVSSKISFDILFCEDDIRRHAKFQLAFGIANLQLDRVHCRAASLHRLDVAGRELSLIRDKRNRCGKRLVREGIDGDCCSLSQ